MKKCFTLKVIPWLMAIGLLFAALPDASAQNVNVTGATLTGGPSYATLKAAFDDINGNSQAGNTITVTVVNNTTETATAALNAGAWTSVLVTADGSIRTVQGAITAGSPLIDLNGADNVTIDGQANAGGLFISNTTASATPGTSTIRFQNDATNNIVTRCTILGASSMATTTNGGTIWFAAGATTTGNDNNTVSFCDIGPSGTTPAKAIYGNGTTTTATLNNSGISILNNNIYDYFQPAASSHGIYISGGNTNWTINNNKFYQTATRTVTGSALTHAGIQIVNTSSGNGFTIRNNTIGFSSSGGTGTYTIAGSVTTLMYGISYSGQSTDNSSLIKDNQIRNISFTSTSTSTTAGSSAFSAINIPTTAAAIVIVKNTLQSFASVGSGTGAHNFIDFNSSGSGASVLDSNTVNSFTRTSSGLMHGIRILSPTNLSVQNNNFSNIQLNSASSTSSIYGFYANTSNQTVTISNNTFSNFTTTSTAGATIIAIREFGSSTGTKTFTNNTIFGLGTSGGAGTSTIGGISEQTGTSIIIEGNTIRDFTGGSTQYGINIAGGTTASISKNRIYGLTTATTTPTVSGILVAGTTTKNISNNLIGLLGATAANVDNAVRGINITSTTGTNNITHNTIYLAATSSGGTFGTSGIFHTASATGTAGTLNLRNNIIYNASTPNGTGLTVAIRRTAGATANSLNNYGAVSNNNMFYAGTPGANNLIYHDGTTGAQTLANFKAFTGTPGTLAPREAASASEALTWQSLVGNNANFLKYSTGTAFQVEQGGLTGTGVADDFGGTLRCPDGSCPGAPGATTPDMGAWELNGTPLDINPPSASLSLAAGCAGPGAQTLNATITDGSGVPTAGIGLPRVYWRINAGGWNTAVGTHSGGNNYTFTIGTGAVLSDVVEYYAVAQDNLGNVGATPSAGAGGYSIDPPAAATPPTTPASYTVVSVISVTAGSPYLQDFESGQGGWVSGVVSGTNSWAFGTANKTDIKNSANPALVGTNVWTTGGLSTGTYNGSEASFVQSPCFDLSGLSASASVRFTAWWESEANWDGAKLQYSTNGGTTWNNVGVASSTWYNLSTMSNTTTSNTMSFAGQPWWCGRNSSSNGSAGWVERSSTLPAGALVSGVIFRIGFASDGSGNDDGFAFDNFEIFVPPCDGPPTGLFANGITGSTANANWTNNPSATSGYEYRYKKSTDVTWSSIVPLGVGVTTASLSGLDAGTQYDFQVRSMCAVTGDWSGTLNFTTLYDPLQYLVTRATGITYTSIAGQPGTNNFRFKGASNSNDDVLSQEILWSWFAPGFDFKFQGRAITSMKASSNGFLTLDPTVTSSSLTNQLGGAYSTTRALIAPFWDDLRAGSTGTDSLTAVNNMLYRVDGTAPNRIMTIEFRDFIRFGVTGNTFNFQVKLYETSYNIEILYGQMQAFNFDVTPNSPQMSYSVGLKGFIGDQAPYASSANVLALQETNTNQWNRAGTRTSYTNGYGPNNLNREVECNSRYLFTFGGSTPPGTAPAITAPANDDPGSATVIVSSLTVPTNVCGSVYNTRGATATDLTGFYNGKVSPNDPVLGGIPDDDVWFRFTANAPNVSVRTVGGYGFRIGIQIFDANLDTITGIQPVVATANSQPATLNAIGLSIGFDYYIRVFHYAGGTTATGTATFAGDSVNAITLGLGGAGYITGPTPLVQITGGGGSGAVYSASVSGGAVTGFNRLQGGFGYTSAPTVTVSAPGWGYNGEFALLVNATPDPSNNDNLYKYATIPAAYNVTVGSGQCNYTITNQSTIGNNADAAYAACSNTPDDSRWYRFVATETTTIVSLRGKGGFNPAFQVFNAGSGGLLADTATMTSVSCPTAAGANGTTTATLTTVVGNVYWMRVYHAGAGSGGAPAALYDLCVYSPTPLGYAHSQSSGTWTPIAGGTVVVPAGTVTTGTVYKVFFPATVTFNGASYDSAWVNTNGHMTFGGPPTASTTNVLSTTTVMEGALSAWGGTTLVDAAGAAEIRMQQVGNEVVVQWLNFRRTGSTGEDLSFQIRLNTVAPFEVRYVYGPFTWGTSTTSAICGLRSGANTFPRFVHNRTANTTSPAQTWLQTTLGTSNTTTLAVNSTIQPVSGLTFTWTPTTCKGFASTFAAFPTTVSSSAGQDTARIRWRRIAGVTGYEVRYRRNTDALTVSTWTTPLVMSGGVADTTTQLTGLSASRGYFWEVRAVCSPTEKSHYSAAASFNTAAKPLEYAFSQTTSTWTPIAGGTVIASGTISAANSYDVTLPAAVTFNGDAFTEATIYSNGYISFGGSITATTTNPLSNTTALSGIVAVSAGGLRVDAGGAAEIRMQQVGSEVIVQWTGMRRSGSTGEDIAYQVRFNTSNDEIRYVYGPHTIGTSTTSGVVGMRSGSNVWPTFVRNRTTFTSPDQQDWQQTTTGSANSSTLTFNSTVFPPSGLTFVYTPTTCQVFPAHVNVLTAEITTDGAIVKWRRVPGSLGYDVRVRSSVSNTYSAPIAVGATDTDTTYTFTGLNNSTVYVFDARAKCGAANSHYGTSGVFTTLGLPMGYEFAVSTGTYTPLASPTVLTSGTFDNTVYNVDLGPDPIEINGAQYGKVQMSTNGWIMGGGTSTGSDYDPLFGTAGTGVISPFARDLEEGDGGVGTPTVGWGVDGSEVVFEWNNVREWFAPGQHVSVQARYNKVSKVWRFMYGGNPDYGTATNDSVTVGVGIRGGVSPYPRDVQNKVTLRDWTAPSTGTAQSSEMMIRSSDVPEFAKFPTEGLTYTWTPTTSRSYPVPFTVPVVDIGQNDATVSWRTVFSTINVKDYATDGYEIRYRAYGDPTSVSTWATPTVASTSPTDTNFTITGLAPLTTYYFEVRAVLSPTVKGAFGPAGTFTTFINDDVGVTALTSPLPPPACGSASVPVAVNVTNFGVLPQSNIPVQVVVSGPTNTVLNGVLAGPLAPGASQALILSNINTATIGTYNFICTTQLVGDGRASNDSFESNIGITKTNAPPQATATATPSSIITGGTSTLAANVTSLPKVGGTFAYSGSSQTIPDDSPGPNLNVVVSGVSGSTAGDLVSVKINLLHTFRGDVEVSLTSPGGVTVLLISNRGSSGDNFQNLTLGTSGPSISTITSTTSSATDFTTVYTPDNPFTDFGAGPANGTWVLNATDNVGGIAGSINLVELTFENKSITNTWTIAPTFGVFPFNGTNPPIQTLATAGTYNFQFTTEYDGGGCGQTIPVPVLVSDQNRWLGVDNSSPTNRWNVQANWLAVPIPTAGYAVEIPSDVPFSPTVSGSVSVTNLNMKAGSNINLETGSTFNVSGSVTGQANSSITGPGSLVFNGAVAQPVNGFVTVNNLRISNTTASGVFLQTGSHLTLSPSAAANSGVLTLDPLAKINTTNGKLILASTATGTASIGPVPGSASFTGPVIQQRYIDGFTTGDWYFVGTPIKDKDVSQFNDDIYTYGPMPGVQVPNPGPNTSSIFLHKESGTTGGTDPETDGWEVPNAANNANGPFPAGGAIQVGRGYRLFLNGLWKTSLQGFAFEGIPTVVTDVSPFNFALGYTPGAYGGGGWNFVANPLPSAINWDHPTGATGWTKTNVDNAIYIWNQTGYGSYVAGIGTNGVTNIIPSSQGFFVKANAASPILRARENVKSSAANTFTRVAAIQDLVRMTLINATGTRDESVVAFRSGATDDFDSQYDAYELSSPMNIGTLTGATKLAINCLAPLADESRVVPMNLMVPTAGTYHLKFSDMENFNSGFTIYLRDNLYGSLTAVSNGSVVEFTVTNDAFTQGDDRFELVFSPNSVTDVKTLKGGNGFRLFPNPSASSSAVTLSVRGVKDASGAVTIVDVLGKVVYSEKVSITSEAFVEKTLDLNLASGVYTVQFRSASASYTEKLIVR